MSDGSLSQDEIDALLTGGLDMNFDEAAAGSAAPAAAAAPSIPVDITAMNGVFSQNISSIDSVLKSMLDDTSTLSAPVVSPSNREDLIGQIADEVVVINADFADQVSGQHFYVLSTEMAAAIAGKMQGLEQAELNDAGLGALEEAINTIAGTTSTFLSSSTGQSVSTGTVNSAKQLKASISGLQEQFVKIVYPYSFDGAGASEIIEVIGLNAASALFPAATPAAPQQPMMGGQPAPQVAQQPMGGMPQQQMMQQPMQQMGGMPMQQMMPMGQMPMQQMQAGMPAGVQPVQFTPLNAIQGNGESGNIGLLMDVYMEMTVELGRTKRLIKDILGMGEGTIIELDKLAGEPVDILVNHKLIAKGEVVVIDENFGVRVTEIVSPMERVTDV